MTGVQTCALPIFIYNLIDNAIKFCPDGGRLALRLQLDGGKARVTVENTGPTIDKDELPLLFLLLDFTEKKQFRRIIPIWAGKLLMGAYLSVLGMAVLGSRMAHADHPFFAIVSVSQPLSTQRADAIYLLVFVMLCVLRITLFTVLAAHLLRLCFPKLRYTSTVCLLLMLGISWGASAVTVPDFVSLAFLGILVLLIPGLLLFLPERRRQAT